MKFGRLLIQNIILRGLNIAVSLIVIVLLTRLMGVEGYGVLSLLVANASIFSLISCLGAESGITYHSASGTLQRGKIFTIIIYIILFQLVLLGFVEWAHFSIYSHYWLLQGNEIRYLGWGLLYLFSLSVIDKYTAFLNSHHLYTLANKIILLGNLVSLVLFAILFFGYAKQDTFFYLQLFILSTFLQAVLLVTVFHVRTKLPVRLFPVRNNEWKLFFSYSFVVFITNVIQFLAYRVDYWLVVYYRNHEALGLYSLAMRLCQMFWVIPILFAGIIFPRVADRNIPFDNIGLLKLTRITGAFIFICMLPAALLAGWLIPWFFGAAFSQSVTVFVYLLPGFLLFSYNILLAAWFAGKNKLYINLTGSAICFVLVFILDIWLIPVYGIEGAAIASCLAYAAAGIFSMVMFIKTERFPVYSFFILKKNDWQLVKRIFKNSAT
jgi:O-antigen/teichoic acid export membrane protein